MNCFFINYYHGDCFDFLCKLGAIPEYLFPLFEVSVFFFIFFLLQFLIAQFVDLNYFQFTIFIRDEVFMYMQL
jgi:hypothetical protein